MSKKKLKIIAVVLLIGFLIWLIGYCMPPPPPLEKKTHQNQNITLFIDLSDHLDETRTSGKGGIMGKDRWENFIDFTKSFGDVYTEKILTATKKRNQYNEKIHIRTHPTTDFRLVDEYLKDIELDKKSIKFSYNVKDDKTVITSQLVKSIEGIMKDSRKKYNINAIRQNKWPGSNIYDYFKGKQFYNPEDQNLLIIYTDGYPFHEDNLNKKGQYFTKNTHWKTELHDMNQAQLKDEFEANPNLGMKAATADLEHLRVLIIGGKTKGSNIYEKELVQFLWSNWLQKMGVKQKNFQMLFMDDCDTPSLKSAYKWLLNTPWDM
ncbi:hypothetical protein N9E11_01585 [Crocinitomicaceae bacterium]|nr:hypothetical protein [Crocinitomicaceae bacterium]